MIELGTGIYAHSLALLADSFHMLNDIISLLISWQALKLASRPSNANHSYGYARAEILAAFGNAIFLLALCFSIFLEAIQRFIDVQEVSNPKLMVIVGGFGLLSNIVGLFLFHEHGHGHSHGHSHSHGDVRSGDNAIEANPSTTDENAEVSSGGRPIARRERSDSFGSLYGHPALTRAAVIETAQEFGYGRSPPAKGTRDSFNMAFSPTGPEDSTHGTANPITHHSRSKSAQHKRKSVSPPDESSRLTNGSQPISYAAVVKKSTKIDDNGHDHANGKKHSHSEDHSEAEAGGHSHGGGGHGHSHGNMNAQGVFLHVLGDALGNVGVIAAGLVIWFAKGYWRFYFDPAISLLITVIIFHSALPLVKSASFILLQGVPTHISLEAVRSSIYGVNGVISLHETVSEKSCMNTAFTASPSSLNLRMKRLTTAIRM
ncbi:hypothetical protein QFC24_001245 [Naganishia onofrii]|uniref:Uncharacterized protein n=1 Tax=Naganishia onofrii TaxID=1851511 RepID=A0ACC2XSK1_9TREE|nr:hypothetical protein QFC24_001245 [Naganishia onofrii]